MKNKLLTLTGALCAALVLILGGCAWLGFGTKAEVVEEVTNFTNSMLLQNVTKITDDGLAKARPVISPDGTKLMYCETKQAVQPDGTTMWMSDIILLRNLPSSAKTPLITTGNAFEPGWYEDNTRFLFSLRENNNSRIVRSTIAGGGRTNITRNPVGTFDGSPRIRNGIILFVTLEGSTYYIYSTRENGSEVTRLTEGQNPAWHPSEPKFLYVKKDGNTFAIWEMDILSNQETLLYPDPLYNCANPQYTYDGKYIVFQKGSEQAVTGTQVITIAGLGAKTTNKKNTVQKEARWQIVSMGADGSNLSPLTEGNVDCISPSLDQDNNLYFLSNASGVKKNKYEVYRARLNFE